MYRNPDYLTRLFRSRTGRSISNYIIDKRLQMVKQLLEKTDLSIVRISKKGGFSYSSCFVRLFRKKVGTMPPAVLAGKEAAGLNRKTAICAAKAPVFCSTGAFACAQIHVFSFIAASRYQEGETLGSCWKTVEK